VGALDLSKLSENSRAIIREHLHSSQDIQSQHSNQEFCDEEEEEEEEIEDAEEEEDGEELVLDDENVELESSPAGSPLVDSDASPEDDEEEDDEAE